VEQNEFAHQGRGNFWSNYSGYDADRDGVGDQPYAPSTLFENLIDREPKLRLMLFSPAHDAIDFIGRAMPATRAAPKFRDTSPLVAPIVMAGAPDDIGAGPLARVALLLLAASGLLITVASDLPGALVRSIRRRARPVGSLKASQP
jgi:nitrous oxidase accessory protein